MHQRCHAWFYACYEWVCFRIRTWSKRMPTSGRNDTDWQQGLLPWKSKGWCMHPNGWPNIPIITIRLALIIDTEACLLHVQWYLIFPDQWWCMTSLSHQFDSVCVAKSATQLPFHSSLFLFPFLIATIMKLFALSAAVTALLAVSDAALNR